MIPYDVIITAVLLSFGIAMACIPMLPAISYMFVVALVFGFFDHFSVLSSGEVLTLFGVVVLSIIIDSASGVLGAKYGGAHAKSLLWGILGMVVGSLFFPILGSFFGLFVGVLVSELYHKKSQQKAFKAAGSALLGSVIGVVINVTLALMFLGLFLYFTLF